MMVRPPYVRRHSRLAWFASDRVVSPLSVSPTDWMNWRKIDHVEPHRFCVVHAGQAITESRSTIALTLCRAREKFIPRAEHCRETSDHYTGNRRLLRGIGTVRVGRH